MFKVNLLNNPGKQVDGVDKIFSCSPLLEGRYLKIPDSPGWGCNLNEKKLKKFFSAKN